MLNPKNLDKGQEQFESYKCGVTRKRLIQYDYRHTTGQLFSTVASSLDMARQSRNRWLAKNGLLEGVE